MRTVSPQSPPVACRCTAKKLSQMRFVVRVRWVGESRTQGAPIAVPIGATEDAGSCQASFCESFSSAHGMPVGVVLLAHRVPVDGMRVPLQAPASVHVTVVPPEPDIQRPDEGGDERDVGERTADEVVAPAGRPVEQVVQAGRDGHGSRLATVRDGYLKPNRAAPAGLRRSAFRCARRAPSRRSGSDPAGARLPRPRGRREHP